MKNMIVKNNVESGLSKLQMSNVCYKFVCKTGDCETRDYEVAYIGQTQTQLTRRITMHLGTTGSAIKEHYMKIHRRKPTRDGIVSNTEIIKKHRDVSRLVISEGLLIKKDKPILNKQDMTVGRVLKLFG